MSIDISMIDQSTLYTSFLQVASYLSFVLAGELFAIPVGKVQEILSTTKITKVSSLYERGN
jgi:chemotaxis signal transduction protein